MSRLYEARALATGREAIIVTEAVPSALLVTAADRLCELADEHDSGTIQLAADLRRVARGEGA